MNIIAVVVTYNRLELLKRNIGCLQKNKELSSILVVNNGSTDGTEEWLNTQSEIHVIHQENQGGSGGFYIGIQEAYKQGAEWIWCMDDDVFPRQDCLRQLLKYTDRSDIGIMAPRRLVEGKIFTHEFQKYNFNNPLASMKKEKLAGRTITEATEIVGADFEGPFIRRNVVETIGLPNKEFFIFCDDTDYCLRAWTAGFKLLYVPDAILDKHHFFVNDSWTTRNQKKKWKRYYQVRNTAYLNHHYGKNWGVRYLRSLINVSGYMIIAFITIPFSKAWKWGDMSMLRKAYLDGIHERLGIFNA